MSLCRRLLLLTAVSILLAACASGPPFRMAPADSEKATIYAFRTSSIVGGANSDIVAVNDRFIGRLNSGTYAVYKTGPGELRVTRKAGSILGSGESAGWGLGGLVGAIDGFVEVVNFTGEPGRIYFVRFPHGKLVPNQEAMGMMDGLENVTPEAH
jgi:Protein of unknown function (DUF2846)